MVTLNDLLSKEQSILSDISKLSNSKNEYLKDDLHSAVKLALIGKPYAKLVEYDDLPLKIFGKIDDLQKLSNEYINGNKS
jgi:hypothetical protein